MLELTGNVPTSLNTDSTIVISVDTNSHQYILADEITLIEETDTGNYSHSKIKIL